MKKIIAYGSLDKIEQTLLKGYAFHHKYIFALDNLASYIVRLPITIHVQFIRFRLRVTDSYLEAKVKDCDKALKVMAKKRKELAEEHLDARKMLKKMRLNYHY